MKRHGSESGHTIIEAAIATLILLVGLIPVANLFIVAGTSVSAAHHLTAAVAQASEIMETLRAIPFDHLKPGGNLSADRPLAEASASPVLTDENHDLRLYGLQRSLPGVGTIATRWQITAVDHRTLYIQVVTWSTAAAARGRSRVALAAFRTCTADAPPAGCP